MGRRSRVSYVLPSLKSSPSAYGMCFLWNVKSDKCCSQRGRQEHRNRLVQQVNDPQLCGLSLLPFPYLHARRYPRVPVLNSLHFRRRYTTGTKGRSSWEPATPATVRSRICPKCRSCPRATREATTTTRKRDELDWRAFSSRGMLPRLVLLSSLG